MAGSEKAERKEVEKEEGKEEKSGAQKKSLVDETRCTIDEIKCVSEMKEEEVKEKGKKEKREPQGGTISWKIWVMALLSFDIDADLVECRRCSGEAEAERGSGSAGNHYRVGCGGRHFRGPGWQKPLGGTEG